MHINKKFLLCFIILYSFSVNSMAECEIKSLQVSDIKNCLADNRIKKHDKERILTKAREFIKTHREDVIAQLVESILLKDNKIQSRVLGMLVEEKAMSRDLAQKIPNQQKFNRMLAVQFKTQFASQLLSPELPSAENCNFNISHEGRELVVTCNSLVACKSACIEQWLKIQYRYQDYKKEPEMTKGLEYGDSGYCGFC